MSISHTLSTAIYPRSFGSSHSAVNVVESLRECMAMGSWVGTLTDCQLACVYCSTYRAIEYFLRSDTKWFDMLQLGGQVRLYFIMHVLHFVHFIIVGQLCCECIHEQGKSFCFCLLVAVLSKRQ